MGAALLGRFVGWPDFGRPRDLGRFLVCAVAAGPLCGALIGSATITVVLHGAFIPAFGPYWAGDGLAVLTVGSALLCAPAARSLGAAAAGPLLAVLATGLCTVVGFWPNQVPLAYLVLPVLGCAGVRYGVATLISAGLVMTLTANVLTAAGHGPWAALAHSPRVEAASLQLFLAVGLLGAWAMVIGTQERAEAQARLREESAARHRIESLQRVTALIATAATTEAIAAILATEGIPLIAEHGVIGVVSIDGHQVRTWPSVGFPRDIARQFELLPLAAHTQLTIAIRTGRTVVFESLDQIGAQFPDTMPSYRVTDTRSALALPVQTGGITLAGLVFGFRTEGPIDPQSRALADILVELTAQALDRARLYEREHRAAHELQRALMPTLPSTLPGVAIDASYRPADITHDVGGDWYDVFALPRGRVGVAIGDVVGHDLRAAASMGKLQALLRMIVATGTGPADVLSRLDDAALQITTASAAPSATASTTPQPVTSATPAPAIRHRC